MNTSIINKANENKVFRNGTIDGYKVAAIDGTMLFQKVLVVKCTLLRCNNVHRRE